MGLHLGRKIHFFTERNELKAWGGVTLTDIFHIKIVQERVRGSQKGKLHSFEIKKWKLRTLLALKYSAKDAGGVRLRVKRNNKS